MPEVSAVRRTREGPNNRRITKGSIKRLNEELRDFCPQNINHANPRGRAV